MSQKSTEKETSYSPEGQHPRGWTPKKKDLITTKFEVIITTDGEVDLENCVKEFNELLEEWRLKVHVTRFVIDGHDARPYEEMFDVSEEENEEKK